ncbi:MAG TPA: ATP-binding protein [Blastocatellia bacterium]|nr:ATP-binding protein [Blastocatellia bacterium]
MSDKVKFLMSFRARLMMLLTSFLLLTIAFVLVLDNWASNRAEAEIAARSGQVREAFTTSFGDFAQAVRLAIEGFDQRDFMYNMISPEDMPPTVQHIIVTKEHGEVEDSTLPELIGKSIDVPQHAADGAKVSDGDPVEGEIEIHGKNIKTYHIPTETLEGLRWVIVVMKQEAIINQIETAQRALADKNKELSDYRIAATTGLLTLALAIAVVIGWRFTRPIKELAGAARRVAAGDLDFQVKADRPDEVGQLAATFNEMITQLKSKHLLEEKLNQAERAAVIGRLTQAVAHEIRNPLNVINLSIDHASTRYAPEDEARRKQFTRLLSSIKDEIARLNRMVSDVLNFGRPARMAVETVDLNQLVGETMSLVRAQADEQGVEVSFENDSEPVRVQGDQERLKSCVSNIAINALQAMPGGGHLSARVVKNNGYVEVSISDTGVGIPEEALPKIFDAYYSTKQTGFGLGLAVTKKIIEEHQGSIDVKSEIDGGTTFTLRLPAVNA